VPVGPVTFLALFVTASLVAIFSHVPAGLGVFEAVILVAMPDTPAQPAVAAALVIYRIVYYLLPLILAGLVLGLAQLRRLPALFPGLDRLVRPWARLALPNLLAPLVGICSVVLLVSGVTPSEQARMALLAQHVPLPLIEAAHFLASLTGLVLLPLALGLRRRLDAAWIGSTALLAAGIALSLLKGLDWEEALLLAMALLILLPTRRAFYRRSALTAQRFSPSWLLAILAVLLSVTWLGFFAYRHVEYGPQLWWQFLVHADAPRFLRATAGCFVLLLLLGIVQLVGWGRPPRPGAATPADLDRAAAAIAAADSPPSNAWVALLGDKQLLFSDSGRSFVMYGIRGRSWIALAEPVGLRAERLELLWRFRELADRWGARIAFYEAPPEAMPELVELGLTFQKLGEQAFVDLPSFSLEGGRRASLRQALARGRREGSVFEVVAPEGVPAILDRLAEISDAWLAAKTAREKGFSLGRFDRAYLARLPVAVVRREGRIVAFANLWPAPDRHELSIDLMRYGPDAPREVMEYLFLELMLWGKAEGYGRFDLGMAPLSGLESRQLAPILSQAGAQIFQHGEDFYNFEGLRRYKEKFRPVWEPRYLAAPGGMALARVLADATLLIGGGVKGVLGR
jgi:phosphatidylglycerol lysyltransferase